MKTEIQGKGIFAPSNFTVRTGDIVGTPISTNPLGFNEVFEPVVFSNDNEVYVFKTDDFKPKSESLYNGVLVKLPIPQGFCNSGGTIINELSSTVIPLILFLQSGKGKQKLFSHTCHINPDPDAKGTECAELLQRTTEASYFNTTDVNIPPVKGNSFYNQQIANFNMDSSNKKVFYLPTVTSNGSIIYVVTTKEAKIKKIINEAYNADAYSIALNGFIFQIDSWNCSVIFDDFIAFVNGENIKSTVSVVK